MRMLYYAGSATVHYHGCYAKVKEVRCRDHSDDVITGLALGWTTSSSSPSPVERRARSAAVVWFSSSITRANGDTS